MSFHLASLFSLKLDRDLLPYWLKHYAVLPLDSATVFFHGAFDKEVFDKAKAYGFTSHFIEGEFRDGTLRYICMEQVRRSLSPTAKLMVVDSDEFVTIPTDLMALVNEYDILPGMVYDCWGDLTGLPREHPHYAQAFPLQYLKDTYPITGDFYGVVARAKKKTIFDKVLVSRADIIVNFTGSHNTLPGEGTGGVIPPLRIYERHLPIMHYSFRSNIIERMEGKSYYTPEEIDRVRDYYGVFNQSV